MGLDYGFSQGRLLGATAGIELLTLWVSDNITLGVTPIVARVYRGVFMSSCAAPSIGGDLAIGKHVSVPKEPSLGAVLAGTCSSSISSVPS